MTLPQGGTEPKCPKGCSCVSHSDRDGFTCPPNPGFIDYTPPAHLWEHNPVVDPHRLDATNHIWFVPYPCQVFALSLSLALAYFRSRPPHTTALTTPSRRSCFSARSTRS